MPVPTAVPPCASAKRRGLRDVVADLRAPAPEFLSQRYRHRVHEMSSPGLDDISQLCRLAVECCMQMTQSRQELVLQLKRGTHMDCRGYHVVAALAHVDVIVGVNVAPRRVAREVCDHLVGIHV